MQLVFTKRSHSSYFLGSYFGSCTVCTYTVTLSACWRGVQTFHANTGRMAASGASMEPGFELQVPLLSAGDRS